MQAVSPFFANIINMISEPKYSQSSFYCALHYLVQYFKLSVSWNEIPALESLTVDNYSSYKQDLKLMLIATGVEVAQARQQSVLPVLFAEQDSDNYYILYRRWGRYKLIAATPYYEPVPFAKLKDLRIAKAWICSPIGLPIYADFMSLLKGIWQLMRYDFFIMVLFGIFTASCSLFSPLVSSYIFGHIYKVQEYGQAVVFVSFMLMFLGMAIFTWLNDLYVKNCNLKWLLYIMPSIWQRLLSLPFKIMQRYPSADLSQKLIDYDAAIGRLMSALMVLLFTATAMVILFCYMWYCQWQLAIVCAIICITVLCFKTYLIPKNIACLSQGFIQQSQLSQFTYEILLQIHKIRSSGAEQRIYKQWLMHLLGVKTCAERSMYIELVTLLSETSIPILLMFSVYLVLYFIAKPVNTVNLLQFMVCVSQFTAIFDKFSSQFVSFIHLLPSLRRLGGLANEAIEGHDLAKSNRKLLNGSITFKDVSLRQAETGQAILNNISLTIPAGKFIGIIGHSGAGKTSLFKLLLGFDSLSAGMIEIDGLPLPAYNVKELRRQIGVVMQTTTILPGTIFSNLSAQVDLTHEEAWRLAKMVGLDSDIAAMPMKMNTYISDNAGESLSGGQKQKIMLARALAAKPRILLLDEATSALDNISQALIFNNLQTLNITRVVIAHRYSTIAKADGIYVLDQGRVVNYGTYEELGLATVNT